MLLGPSHRPKWPCVSPTTPLPCLEPCGQCWLHREKQTVWSTLEGKLQEAHRKLEYNWAPMEHFYKVTALLAGSETHPPLCRRVLCKLRDLSSAPNHLHSVALGLGPGAELIATKVSSSQFPEYQMSLFVTPRINMFFPLSAGKEDSSIPSCRATHLLWASTSHTGKYKTFRVSRKHQGHRKNSKAFCTKHNEERCFSLFIPG